MALSKNLNELINELRKFKEHQNKESLVQVEDLLSAIASLHDPEHIPFLVSLLEDDDSQDDIMFLIVHVIEAFDDDIYINKIIPVLPELWVKSPRWAKILHMRILNSPATMKSYEERLMLATEQQKYYAKCILNGVVEWRPEFRNRVKSIIDQLIMN